MKNTIINNHLVKKRGYMCIYAAQQSNTTTEKALLLHKIPITMAICYQTKFSLYSSKNKCCCC